MTSVHFNNLPSELRLNIYGRLLHSHYPLKRAKSKDLKAARVNTSILTVSKQTHEEAKDVLYELNTISLSFPEFYYAHDGKVHTNPVAAYPYRTVQVFVEEHMRCCDIRRLVSVLLKASTSTANTKLKSFTIQLKDDYPVFKVGGPMGQPGYHLQGSIRSAGMGIRFTKIACLDILAPVKLPITRGPRVRLEWPDAVKAWNYFSALPSSHKDLLSYTTTLKPLGGIAGEIEAKIKVLVRDFYHHQAHAIAEKKQQSSEVEDEKLCSETEHTAEWVQKATEEIVHNRYHF